MTQVTKTRLKAVWNGLVIVSACFVTFLALRFIVPQFLHSVTPGMVAQGFHSLGCLVFILIVCATALSPLWFHVPLWFRWFLGLLLSVFAVGAYFIEHALAVELGPYAYFFEVWDYIFFFGAYLLCAFPFLLFGCGYPALFSHFFTRWRNGRNA